MNSTETEKCVTENKTKIQALEKQIDETKSFLLDLGKKFDRSAAEIHNKIDTAISGIKEDMVELSQKMIDLAQKPGWLVMLIITSLASLCTGLLVWLIRNG